RPDALTPSHARRKLAQEPLRPEQLKRRAPPFGIDLLVASAAGMRDAGAGIDGGAGKVWDHKRYFARVASDPYVNFSNNHLVRVAGFRF
ncbi:MAG: hypothetical protein ABI547_02245, partial [Betaproteobacteria bacterium]